MALLAMLGCTPVMQNPVPMQTIEPEALPNNVFGITLDALDQASGLDQVAAAGTGWTRKGFVWRDIEPSEGDRFWNTELEQGIIKAVSLGVQPIMVIEGTPSWALKPGFICGAVAEEKFGALENFVLDLVKRYSVPPYNVHYWELWNEPEVHGGLGCWGNPNEPFYGAEYYSRMLQLVSPLIKEADPLAQVLVGGLLLDCDPANPPEGKDCSTSTFLNGILESGGGPYFDGVSFHAYDYSSGTGTYSNANWNSSSSTTGPVSIAKAKYLRQVLSDYGYQDKYLMNTETAVFWGPNVHDPPCDPNAPAEVEVTKVYYVVESYAVAVAEGWKANVWYSLFGVRCSGLMNSDLSPKAGFNAYQFARQKLGSALFVREIREFDGVMGYEYKIPGKVLWVLWSLDGQIHTINLPELPMEVNRVHKDGLGMRENNSSSLLLDVSPLFVEFER